MDYQKDLNGSHHGRLFTHVLSLIDAILETLDGAGNPSSGTLRHISEMIDRDPVYKVIAAPKIRPPVRNGPFHGKIRERLRSLKVLCKKMASSSSTGFGFLETIHDTLERFVGFYGSRWDDSSSVIVPVISQSDDRGAIFYLQGSEKMVGAVDGRIDAHRMFWRSNCLDHQLGEIERMVRLAMGTLHRTEELPMQRFDGIDNYRYGFLLDYFISEGRSWQAGMLSILAINYLWRVLGESFHETVAPRPGTVITGIVEEDGQLSPSAGIKNKLRNVFEEFGPDIRVVLPCKTQIPADVNFDDKRLFRVADVEGLLEAVLCSDDGSKGLDRATDALKELSRGGAPSFIRPAQAEGPEKLSSGRAVVSSSGRESNPGGAYSFSEARSAGEKRWKKSWREDCKYVDPATMASSRIEGSGSSLGTSKGVVDIHCTRTHQIVVDKSAVRVFDLDGQCLRIFGGGWFRKIVAAAVDPELEICYVVFSNKKIVAWSCFTKERFFERKLPFVPEIMALDDDGRLNAANGHELVRIDADSGEDVSRPDVSGPFEKPVFDSLGNMSFLGADGTLCVIGADDRLRKFADVPSFEYCGMAVSEDNRYLAGYRAENDHCLFEFHDCLALRRIGRTKVRCSVDGVSAFAGPFFFVSAGLDLLLLNAVSGRAYFRFRLKSSCDFIRGLRPCRLLCRNRDSRIFRYEIDLDTTSVLLREMKEVFSSPDSPIGQEEIAGHYQRLLSVLGPQFEAKLYLSDDKAALGDLKGQFREKLADVTFDFFNMLSFNGLFTPSVKILIDAKRKESEVEFLKKSRKYVKMFRQKLS